MQNGITRRNLIKAAGVAGGAAILSGALSPGQGEAAGIMKLAAGSRTGTGRNPELVGISDIHIHASPDSRDRSINELDFARLASDAGYRAVMYKSNDFSCHDRAYLIRQAVPGFECFGSLCLNRVHGDRVNPVAAEKAVATSGGYCRCVWLPTLDASYQHRHEKRPGQGIPVLGSTGDVLPEVVRVMEICAEADIILASGHASPEETLVLARKAHEVGVDKFVVTHANSLIWKMSTDQVRKAVDLGAWIEFCYLPCLWGPGTGLAQYEKDSEEEFLRYLAIAPERSFISTDLGQVGMPNPLEGMLACIRTLERGGLQRVTINNLVRRNPATLVGLAPQEELV